MIALTPAIFNLPGGVEWIIIGIVALLIFGRRLPEVARSVGKSIVEFKRRIKDVKDDIETQSQIESQSDHSLPSTPDDAKTGNRDDAKSEETGAPSDQRVAK
jgi:sec-independent protein translocase protein TatA